MAKPTLLEIVQDVLSDMSGDVVNSIDDTTESEQVAYLVRSTFNAMMANRNWPHTQRTVTLTPSGSSLFPTHMTLSEPIKELISIYYNKLKFGTTQIINSEIKWKEPDDFLRYINSRNSDADQTLVINDPTGITLLIDDNKHPDYFTSFDDNTLVFDSFDSTVDSTLQASKTTARAYVIPTFTMSDSYVPDLPLEAFPALIEEVKSKASFKLRSVNDVKAEQESVRQQNWLSRKAWRVSGGVRYPDYGRKTQRVAKDVTFQQGR